MSDICLIYAGGTFGCHGKPLSALPADVFLPAFKNTLTQNCHILNNSIVKDGSALTCNDFLQFYHTIITAHRQGFDKFLLITGTDTLAYLSAFLYFALNGLPLTLVVTGSMHPFFEPTTSVLTPDTTSDAKDNLAKAIQFLNTNHQGVFVAFYHQIFYANSIQKIHASDVNAFAGKSFAQPLPATTHTPIALAQTDIQIHSIFCLPNNADVLYNQLISLLDKSASAVIIVGFGAGNTPYSDNINKALKQLIAQGFLVVMATSCPFGYVSDTYQAGAWQYQAGAVSDALPLPALYAKALWICLTYPPEQRRQVWQTLTHGGTL